MPIYTTCLLTGIRCASMLAMRREDVDVQNRTIRLRHVKTMKQGAILPIGLRLTNLLNTYLDEPPWVFCKLRRLHPQPSLLVAYFEGRCGNTLIACYSKNVH